MLLHTPPLYPQNTPQNSNPTPPALQKQPQNNKSTPPVLHHRTPHQTNNFSTSYPQLLNTHPIQLRSPTPQLHPTPFPSTQPLKSPQFQPFYSTYTPLHPIPNISLHPQTEKYNFQKQ